MTFKPFQRIAFTAADTPVAESAKAALAEAYGDALKSEADVIVALGGDGQMLQTLHDVLGLGLETPVYGMNRGSVGFLMNDYSLEGLHDRLEAATHAPITPLAMRAWDVDGGVSTALAINEVSLLRETRQAAKLRIFVDDKERLEELICDGALVATPAGSTAYNLSAHGPILPLTAALHALTPISAFRPRRWRGALLPQTAHVRFDVLEPRKRPVSAVADFQEFRDARSVEIRLAERPPLTLLFDPEHSLEERLMREQFIA